MPDDPRRNRLDEIGRQKAALDAEALKLIRELQDEMMRIAGIPKADRERHLNMSDAERAEIIGLHPITKRGRVSSDMVDSHRIALSESRNRESVDPFLPAIRAAKPKGFTLRSLAAELDISQPTLSAHRLPKSNPNHRKIPQARADRIEELTGWPADARHWPCGIS